MGKPAARLGDKIFCPQKGHGTNQIETGSPDVFLNGMPAARVGDKAACGDAIVRGNSSVLINGKPAAFLGCSTAHGGLIINGSDNILIGECSTITIPCEDYNIHQNDPEHEYDQHFELVDQDGKPANDFAYTINTSQGILDGEVCEQGKTAKVSTKEPEEVTLNEVYQTRIGIRA